MKRRRKTRAAMSAGMRSRSLQGCGFSALSIALGLVFTVGGACSTDRAAKRRSSLPPAGSTTDDGSGLLASASAELASVSASVDGDPAAADSASSQQDPSTTDASTGESKNEGNGKYAGYQFERRAIWPEEIAQHGPYVVDTTLPTGRVDGRVSWRRPPTKSVSAEPSCPRRPSSVPVDAIIVLSSIKRGRGFPTIDGYPTRVMQVGGVFSIARCGIVPRTQVVGPLGAVVRGQQLRDGATKLTASADGQTESDLAMSWNGRGETRIGRVLDSGPIEIRTDKGERAWLYVANHPFHVRVDDAGRFSFFDVPVGRYELTVWHPPLTADGGDEPIIAKRRVTVRAIKRTNVEIKLSE